jgi:predicted O-methyltransferase YrrM
VRLRTVVLVGVLAACADLSLPSLRAQTPDAAKDSAKDIPKILADIKARDKGQLAVSEEDGRFLRILVASTKAKRALEIGGASGYSAI